MDDDNAHAAPVHITAQGWTHTLLRHTVNRYPKYARRSKFNEDEDLPTLIQQAAQQKASRLANGSFARSADIGRNIGRDRDNACQW